MDDSVVLGLGGAIDFELAWDARMLQRLVDDYAIQPCELSTSVVIRSERDLLRSILAFVRDGVGGERFVGSSDVVVAFAEHFPHRATLGGTSVRAALVLSRLGLPSTLHLVSIDDTFRRLLPEGVSFVCSADEDSTDPHLIVQFPADARIRVGDLELRAPHANRLIYVNDPANEALLISPDLGRVLRRADVFLLSGLNSVRDPSALDARLSALRRHMRSLPATALVVYEDACFHVPEHSQRVRDGLLDLIDVYGLNEDEMQAYLGRSVDLLDAADVVAALRDLHALIPARTMVVHTKLWSVAFGRNAITFRTALGMGTAVAGARYLHGDDFTAVECLRVSRRHPRRDASAVARTIETMMPGDVCCVPAYGLSSPAPTTIGLGDSFVGGFLASLAGADLRAASTARR